MIWIILIALAFLFILSVFCRIIMLHPFKTLYYAAVDLYKYIRFKQYDIMKTGKLICYTALFGGGKTLSCVHYVIGLYDRYNGKLVFDFSRKKWVKQKVHIISNVDINRPYEHFESLAQVVRVAEKFHNMDLENDTLTHTIVFGDEFSVQMNSRSFKTNIDPLFLNTLLTCRHHHIMLVYNAQRFQHVDKLLRDVTTYVVECKKIWRVCVQYTYDAFVLENCSDPTAVKPQGRGGWFIRNKDFEAYDTLACVGNLIKSVNENDMESEIEIINRLQSQEQDIGSYKREIKLLKKYKKR